MNEQNLRFIVVRGGQYLPVAERIRWFRAEHPDWTLETDLVQYDENGVLFRAAVRDPSGRVIATGHAYESIAPNYIEIAETSALGRALGAAGYGTASALADDEANERLADAPVNANAPRENGATHPRLCESCSRPITSGQQQISTRRFGRALCPQCQRNEAAAANATTGG